MLVVFTLVQFGLNRSIRGLFRRSDLVVSMLMSMSDALSPYVCQFVVNGLFDSQTATPVYSMVDIAAVPILAPDQTSSYSFAPVPGSGRGFLMSHLESNIGELEFAQKLKWELAMQLRSCQIWPSRPSHFFMQSSILPPSHHSI